MKKNFIPIEEFNSKNPPSEMMILRSIEIEKDAQLADKSEEPLVNEIRKLGVNVDSVWDLVNSDKKHPELIPLLLSQIPRDYHPKIKNALVRALIQSGVSTPEITFALIKELRNRLPQEGGMWDGVKQAITFALSKICVPSAIDELEILREHLKGSFLSEDIDRAIARCRKLRSRNQKGAVKNSNTM